MKYLKDDYSIIYVKTGPDLGRLNFSQLSSARLGAPEAGPEMAAEFPRLGEDLSFQSGLDARQVRMINRMLAVLGIGLICVPVVTLISLSSALFAFFSVLIFWRGFLVFVGICVRGTRRRSVSAVARDGTLPIYSILVPLYQEARVIPQIAQALSKLDWPADRLDIQVLLEVDDAGTIAAAQAAAFPPNTRLRMIPAGGPRTKPNALNHGLSEAFGRYVTVYDAEDIPHPDQLRAAHQAFEMAPHTLVCVQAPLIGDPARGGWLGAQWALEYAVQFGLLLPSLALYRMPLLIGGTSNHFRKDALRALGGWDSWNVTEDADLGMRIARAGLTCGTLPLPTIEETPARLDVWLAQRSRWIKGFLQTWLVLMRTPGKTRQQMGLLPFLSMQLSLGGAILAPLCYAPCTLLLILVLLSPQLSIGPHGVALVWSALIVGLVGDVCAPGRLTPGRWIALLTRPFYWPLHSIAAYRAIWELAKAPFFWAKTPRRPKDTEETAACSTGLSASASPSASSRWVFSHNRKWALFAKRTSAPINSHGD